MKIYRLLYSKMGPKVWIWELICPNNHIVARSPSSYSYRWAARRAALVIWNVCRKGHIIEVVDPSASDFPLEMPKRRKPKAKTGGEHDLIDSLDVKPE